MSAAPKHYEPHLDSEALRNSFISFSSSNEALRARVPAALFPSRPSAAA